MAKKKKKKKQGKLKGEWNEPCMLCFVMLGVLQGFLRFSVLL
jgi:hypothetical protein